LSAAGGGGGLSACNGQILNNVIFRNSADSGGGGLYACDNIIQSNTIASNGTAHTGGGLLLCNALIRSNIIVDNRAGESGGGLYRCQNAIHNNTIAGNVAVHDGGGAYDCRGIENCVIWDNRGTNGAQLHASSEPTYSCIQDWDGGGEGNIAGDPQFAGADGNNFRLLPGSPCIDEGNNSALNSPGLDRDGNLRIAFGTHSLTVDMGAYEHRSRPFRVTDVGFAPILLPGGGRRLVWNSQPNDSYTVWSRYSLQVDEWNKVKTVASEGETTSCTATGLLPWNWRTLFYQVEME